MICFVSFLKLLFLIKDGWTPLHRAVNNSFEEIVNNFMEHQANISIQNKVFIFFLLFVVIFCCWFY